MFDAVEIVIMYTDPHFQRKIFQECIFNLYTRPRHNHCTVQWLWQTFRKKALLTLHVMAEMHFLLQKNLKNIMHGRVKMYVMR